MGRVGGQRRLPEDVKIKLRAERRGWNQPCEELGGKGSKQRGQQIQSLRRKRA